MAENIADVLDEALTLADGSEYRRGDILIKAYPHLGDGKVRIFKVKNQGSGFLNILVAGNLELKPSDGDAVKQGIESKLITQTEIDQILSAVSDMAASGVKSRAPSVEGPDSPVSDDALEAAKVLSGSD